MAANPVDLVALAGLTEDGITVRQAATAVFGVDGVNERALARKRLMQLCEAGEVERMPGLSGRGSAVSPDYFRSLGR